MSCNILKGKKGIIFGALNEQSIAWKAAQRVVEEGAEIVLTNTPISLRLGAINKLAEETGSIVVPDFEITLTEKSLPSQSFTVSANADEEIVLPAKKICGLFK